MRKKSRVVTITPSSGTQIPDELKPYSSLTPFEIFIESDSCGNEIFDLSKNSIHNINSQFSRLYINFDSPTNSKDYRYEIEGKMNFHDKPIFKNNFHPDDLAIANIRPMKPAARTELSLSRVVLERHPRLQCAK